MRTLLDMISALIPFGRIVRREILMSAKKLARFSALCVLVAASVGCSSDSSSGSDRTDGTIETEDTESSQ
ncbi:MAG: hypothetical protein ABIR32_00165, partial [Ilumatobacteraceae bacterium]